MTALYVLESLLVIVTISSFFVHGKKIISPSFIFGLSLLVTCTFSIVGNIYLWNETISYLTVAIVIVSLLLFNGGEYVVARLCSRDALEIVKKPVNKDNENKTVLPVLFSKKILVTIIVIFALGCLFTWLEFKSDVEIATAYGYKPYNSDLMKYLRIAFHDGVRPPWYISVFSLFFMYVGLVFVFLTFYVLFNSSKLLFGLVYALPIIPSVILMYLSTSRSNYIMLGVFFVLSLLISLGIKEYKSYLHFVIFIGLGILVMFFTIFISMGVARKSFIGNNSIWETILSYIGSPIINFNKMLLKVKTEPYFGNTSFSGVYYFLNKFFPSVPSGFEFDEAVILNNGQSSNIYPIFRAWIYDFGLIPSFILSFLFGVGYGYIYQLVLKKDGSFNFVTIYYFYLAYCLILSALSKLGTSTILTWSRIMVIFSIYLITRLFKYLFDDAIVSKQVTKNDLLIVSVDLLGQKCVDGIKIIAPYAFMDSPVVNAIRKLLLKKNLDKLLFKKHDILNFNGTIIVFDVVSKTYIDWLDKVKGNNRIIFWYWNPVSKSVDPKDIPSTFEKWSYSKSDCEKYNLKWNSQFYIEDIMPDLDDVVISNDLCFVGRTKGRENELLKFKENVKQSDISTCLYLTRKKRFDFKNIKYPEPVSYNKYLEIECTSNCFIDLGMNNEVGMTLRALEAAYYNRKILCNYKEIKDSKLNQDNIFFVENINDIDTSKLKLFLEKNCEYINCEYLNYYEFKNWIKRFF